MLFGFHPITGWITYLILRYGIDPRKLCDKCKESIKLEAQICRYCGNLMSQEEINISVKKFKERKE
jgi:predicted amidophosphoribosyltransferase